MTGEVEGKEEEEEGEREVRAPLLVMACPPSGPVLKPMPWAYERNCLQHASRVGVVNMREHWCNSRWTAQEREKLLQTALCQLVCDKPGLELCRIMQLITVLALCNDEGWFTIARWHSHLYTSTAFFSDRAFKKCWRHHARSLPSLADSFFLRFLELSSPAGPCPWFPDACAASMLLPVASAVAPVAAAAAM